MCNNGRCFKSGGFCGKAGVKFSKNACEIEGEKPDSSKEACLNLVSSCKSGVCVRNACQAVASCAVARIEKKLTCLQRSSLSNVKMCSSLNRGNNFFTKAWCKTEAKCKPVRQGR